MDCLLLPVLDLNRKKMSINLSELNENGIHKYKRPQIVTITKGIY